MLNLIYNNVFYLDKYNQMNQFEHLHQLGNYNKEILYLNQMNNKFKFLFL